MSSQWSELVSGLPEELERFFREIAAQPLAREGTQADMGNRNLHYWGPSRAARGALSPEDVERLLLAVVELWRDTTGPSPSGSSGWLMYAWYDEMAGQLRISAAPARDARELPFECRVREVGAREIAEAFLAGDNVVAWEDLDMRDELVADGAAEVPYVLPVSTHRL